MFADESLFRLQRHDGSIPVCRHRDERLLKICIMHRHTGAVPSIMFWDGIGYLCCILLVRIASTLNIQRYISEVLAPASSRTFSACHQPHSKWVKHENTCHAMFENSVCIQAICSNIQELYACCPDLSQIEKVWSMLA
ncbi:transposable element Tc3 transposase [Trichonephila clavipes]|uniref:Transposable element Tc3 transposase n=1 Tax=Trichonephila clavipes TaxID=2585209 RepID=A0A8X6RS48_TRICX|nr:transposable element Tc3 transposase [Trichonephila clavipes]